MNIFLVGAAMHNKVSIPQAVGTVATKELLQQQRSEEVSIPQAVGTVATPSS